MTTTTYEPVIDGLRGRYVAASTRLEEFACKQLLNEIRSYRELGKRIISETEWAEKQFEDIRAKVRDGYRLVPDSLISLKTLVCAREAASGRIVELAHSLEIDDQDYDQLWAEIESGVQ